MYNIVVQKGLNMSVQTTTMSEARANFAEALKSASNGEVIVIKRRGHPDTALIDAELLEDYLASINPRIIQKVQKARKEREVMSFDDAFKDI